MSHLMRRTDYARFFYMDTRPRSSDDQTAWSLAQSRRERIAAIAWWVTRLIMIVGLTLAIVWVAVIE